MTNKNPSSTTVQNSHLASSAQPYLVFTTSKCHKVLKPVTLNNGFICDAIFISCMHAHKTFRQKQQLLNIVALEIQSVCMREWLCQFTLTARVLEQMPGSAILQPILYTSTEESCEDRLFAGL